MALDLLYGSLSRIQVPYRRHLWLYHAQDTAGSQCQPFREARFLPRLNAHFGQRYTVSATEALSEFQTAQLNQRAARHQLERVVDLQAGKGQPWDLVDRFSATAEFKLPLVVVRPECAGILRDLPMDEAKLPPASHSISPYFMENSDPEKYIKKGFAGHVPYGFQRFGDSSKKLTNSALCDFSSNYRRRQSTEWAPVNVVKKRFCRTSRRKRKW
ncbi:unnamed protein product [Leptidea sinapis]|uniref:Uncharacterized protein n=1 Tax=Leptidea sinapis TaxID=189913 RepID=A0A5E4R210_9NEOP|nr:unnamed protein product [Leptidea sinapis]